MSDVKLPTKSDIKEIKKDTNRSVVKSENGSSVLMQQLSSCHMCPVRLDCKYVGLMEDKAKDKGCGDVRRIYFANITKYQKPINVLIGIAAKVETKMMLQELRDGKGCEIASKDWKELVRLKLDIAKEILKAQNEGHDLRQPKIEITVNPLKRDNVIELNPDMYKEECIPEAPLAHGNVQDVEEYKERKQEELNDEYKEQTG